MNRCLVCDKVIESLFSNIFDSQDKVCYSCFNKLDRRNDKFIINKCEGRILYYYNDYFKEILYRYKGSGDYLLRDIFLVNEKEKIKRKYRGYSIVIAPSYIGLETKRGFCHLEGIFKTLNMPIIKCFRKEVPWKQSDKKLGERPNIQNIIKIDKSMLVGVKKVLIVDDVMTSGSTIKTMISQIPPNIKKKVLVLSSNCRILKNEIVWNKLI